jgi:hypothetical protein
MIVVCFCWGRRRRRRWSIIVVCFLVRNVLFVCFTYAHVEYIKCALQSLVILIQTVKEERRVLGDVYDMSRV